MTVRLAFVAACSLALVGCSVPEGGYPVYLGDSRVGTFGGPARAQAAGGGVADQCQQLALRAADPSITDAQRRAAAEYRASIGC